MTRFPASLTTGMHGIEHCIRVALKASPFRSPGTDFSCPGINAFRRIAAFHSTEPGARNGLSLAYNGCSLSRASIPGSKFLACYFASLPACLAARSTVSSTTIAGLPQPKVASSLPARCRYACWLARPLPLPPLPSGTFTSLGIEAFSRFRRLSARLPNPPDFLSLPAAGSISSVGYGSPFLVRYVSGGLLFLKPLGTFSTMHPTSFFVNALVSDRALFSSAFIWLYF